MGTQHLRDINFYSLFSSLKVKKKVAQSCPTLCNSMDCSLPGSFVHGILQSRILEWVAMSSSRGSSWPRDQTWVSCIAGRFFTIWATREASTSKCSLFLESEVLFHQRPTIYFPSWFSIRLGIRCWDVRASWHHLLSSVGGYLWRI